MKIKLIMFLTFMIYISLLASCKNGDSVTTSSPNTTVQEAKGNTNTNSQTSTISEMPEPLRGGPADITINVEGVSIPTSTLIGFYAESHFKADTCIIDNGRINFKNPEGYVQGLYYVSIAPDKYAQIILGEDQKFELSLNANDPLNSVVIKGSEENQVFYDNLKYENEFNGKFQEIGQRLQGLKEGTADFDKVTAEKKALEQGRRDHLNGVFKKHPKLLFTNFKMAGQNPIIREGASDKEQVYFYRQEFWNDVDFSDSRLIRTPVINNKLKRYFTEITPQNADSLLVAARHLIDQTLPYPEYYKYFSNWVVLNYEPGKCTLMDAEALFVKLGREYFTRERAFWADSMEVYAIQNRAMEMGNSLIGQKGPNVTVPGPDGKPKTLFDSKADYLVVYLYAPSCEHCQEETPQLVKWYNENKNNSRDVYAIAIDTEIPEWKDYIQKNNMSFTNVHDPSNRSIYATYYVDVTPEIYVLNKERVIIGKNLKTFQIDTVIEDDK